MTKSNAAVQPINNYYAGGSRRAADLARSVPALQRGGSSVSSISAAKPKKPARVVPMGPTPERLAKGDVDCRSGAHRSIAPVERLRDQNKLDHDARTNQAMFEAACKLKRHFDGLGLGVRAQDLNRVVAGGAADDLTHEEAWVHNHDVFKTACKLMGWSDANPLRGAGRLVVAVVCYEQPVLEAALAHIGRGRTETVIAAGMDRLREGLFTLATFWRMV